MSEYQGVALSDIPSDALLLVSVIPSLVLEVPAILLRHHRHGRIGADGGTVHKGPRFYPHVSAGACGFLVRSFAQEASPEVLCLEENGLDGVRIVLACGGPGCPKEIALHGLATVDGCIPGPDRYRIALSAEDYLRARRWLIRALVPAEDFVAAPAHFTKEKLEDLQASFSASTADPAFKVKFVPLAPGWDDFPSPADVAAFEALYRRPGAPDQTP